MDRQSHIRNLRRLDVVMSFAECVPSVYLQADSNHFISGIDLIYCWCQSSSNAEGNTIPVTASSEMNYVHKNVLTLNPLIQFDSSQAAGWE